MSLSFVAKPIFFRPGSSGGVYPVRLSSRLRGEEIAEYLGAEYCQDNPTHEKRIYLKPRSLRSVRDQDYVDVLDGFATVPLLKKRPKIKVISMTPAHHNHLQSELTNEIALIPHPHINFDNEARIPNESLVGGIMGKGEPHVYRSFEKIRDRLLKEGIELKPCFEYRTKQEMIEFYKHIDFLVVWYAHDVEKYRNLFYVYPGKVINAASFGIPTLSPRLLGYQEMEGYYIPVESHDDIVREAVKLKDGYDSQRLIEKAKEYHISRIAELYKAL